MIPYVTDRVNVSLLHEVRMLEKSSNISSARSVMPESDGACMIAFWTASNSLR
jgi:hypothetical protein